VRELHPVLPKGVSPHPGDELGFVIGANLVATIAAEYRLHRITSRATLERGCKMRESARQVDG
jgi:hypothetical protein